MQKDEIMPRFKVRYWVINTNITFFVLLFLLLISCRPKEQGTTSSVREQFKPDTLSMLINYDGSLFPLPSPYQAAYLIKKHNIPFNEKLANPVEKAKNHTTVFKKALNFGVYGTDLSYLNVYNRTHQSISYLAVLKKISEDLNLTSAFDANFFANFEKNLDGKDSLLFQLSRSYRKIDSYLRENDRNEVGALILAGGWIESLYILTQLCESSPNNREIINRIGEQKHPLDNLVEVLTPYYYKSAEYSEFVDMLIDLAYEFDGIIYSYSYKEPKVDVENKIIYINSISRVVISEYHLEVITNKIESIRKHIVG